MLRCCCRVGNLVAPTFGLRKDACMTRQLDLFGPIHSSISSVFGYDGSNCVLGSVWVLRKTSILLNRSGTAFLPTSSALSAKIDVIIPGFPEAKSEALSRTKKLNASFEILTCWSGGGHSCASEPSKGQCGLRHPASRYQGLPLRLPEIQRGCPD